MVDFSATIRNMVALKICVEQCGVKLTAHFFEEATTFSKVADQPDMYYASAVPKIIYNALSKTHKVNEHVLEDPSIRYKTEWNLHPEPVAKILQDLPGNFTRDRDHLRKQDSIDWKLVPQLKKKKTSKGIGVVLHPPLFFYFFYFEALKLIIIIKKKATQMLGGRSPYPKVSPPSSRVERVALAV
ncbi:unnamed protein product [Arabidopsis halleri]